MLHQLHDPTPGVVAPNHFFLSQPYSQPLSSERLWALGLGDVISKSWCVWGRWGPDMQKGLHIETDADHTTTRGEGRKPPASKVTIGLIKA